MNVRKLMLVTGFALAVMAGWIARGWEGVPAAVQAQSFAAQQQRVSGGVQEWKWPDSLDSPNAAGNIHKILFENGHLRLLEVTIQPGETEPMHGHKYPSVFAMDSPAPSFTDHALDGTNRTIPPQADGQKYPQCRPLPSPQAPHQATITGPWPDHFYRLEFKKVDGDAIKKMTHYPSGN